MNVKHALSLVVAGVVAAAAAVASAEPSLATYCHVLQALAALAGPYLAMTSPQVGGAK